MKREYTFYINHQVFRVEENMEIAGNMYSDANYSEFKELVVHGDCIARKIIKAERLIVHGNLEAEVIIVNNLQVEGNIIATKIVIDDADITGDLIAKSLVAHYSKLFVGGKVKIETISGEITSLSVGT